MVASFAWGQQVVVKQKSEPFDLKQVRLLDSPFKKAMAASSKYLLELDADKLLSGFRDVSGLPQKATKYGGWEARGVAGQTLGHYLSGLSLAYAATGDERFKQKADYVVSELAECQKANGDGFFAAFPRAKEIFAEVAAGDIRTQGFDLNGGWVPWYTLHKDLAGLRDAYLYCGNEQAKTVLLGFCDWTDKLLARLSDEKVQTMLVAEQGGMSEVLADAYAISGDKRYLKLSERFTHKAVIDPLLRGEDKLTGLHANTQIPKIIGLARRYELTGDEKLRKAAEFFWNQVVTDRSFANGGNSNHEHFFATGKMAHNLSPSSAETCNTYNMLKLTSHLQAIDPQAKYADYYERALYNHILASIDDRTGRVIYFMTHKPGTFKTFATHDDSFWCCVGTGLENHFTYGREIYTHTDDSLSVNLFIASTLDWKEKNLSLRQETKYPEEGRSTIKVGVKGEPVELTIRVRQPSWTGGKFALTVNNAMYDADVNHGYYEIKRQWKDGDVIRVEMPIEPRVEPMPDDKTKLAIFAGPVLLAADLGNEDMPEPYARDQLMYANLKAPPAPAIITDDKPVDQWVKPVDGKPLTYRTQGVGQPGDVTLIPLYQANFTRFAIYLDSYTSESWKEELARREAEAARVAALEARTIDQVRTGEQQSEKDHNVVFSESNTGRHMDTGWRDAKATGSFSYDVKVEPNSELICTYWGSDGGNRAFEILVNDKVIATQKLTASHSGEFFHVTTPIPAEALNGKDVAKLTFRGKGGTVGGVFGVRVVRPEK